MVDITRIAVGARSAHLALEVCHDATGLHGFIIVDDPGRGAAFGGIRRRGYASLGAAFDEVSRLARQMTWKTRFADLGVGGAKAVIVDHPDLDRAGAYRVFGEVVERLGGLFYCGPDLGTTEADMAFVRETTRFAKGCHVDTGKTTARGAMNVVAAALAHRFPNRAAGDVRVLIQGLGSVGEPLARLVAAAGHRPILCDFDDDLVERLSMSLTENGTPAFVADPETWRETSADVFVPCAVGRLFDVGDVARSGFEIVAGPANDQLADRRVAREFHDAGKLYVPDFAVSAGGVVEGVIRHTVADEIAATARLEDAVTAMGARANDLLVRAEAENRPPIDVALERIGSR